MHTCTLNAKMNTMLEAIELTVITDPVVVARHRVMPKVRSNFKSACGTYWGHLSPFTSGGWQWFVNRNDNESKDWDAEGANDTPETAHAAMTEALRKLTRNQSAVWD